MEERDVYISRPGPSTEYIEETAPLGTTERVVRRTTPGRTTEIVETNEPAVAVDQVQATAYDPYAPRRDTAYRLVQAVYLVFGLIEALIAIRFVLRLLAANPSAGFAQFIYGITDLFVAPFYNLFGNPRYDASVIDFNALVAIVVYSLLAWLIAKLVWLTMGETRTATVARTRNIQTRVH